jgi:sugar phosphate isomerase/epimerase
MENRILSRRSFAKNVAMAGIGATGIPLVAGSLKDLKTADTFAPGECLKLSLNAYSFDKPLKAGTMTINSLLDYCSKTGFEGVDLTGYYFPGYPVVPEDGFIYGVKKKAFKLGLGISGTGVRNDFTWSDKAKRAEEKKLVREWIIVAEKLGAPVIRIFAGTLSKEDFKWDERAKWIAEDIIECAEFGKKHGVLIGLQNHFDFIKTSSEAEKLLKMVGHEWVGLLLDIGSYHSSDPYSDVEKTSRYAISWQLKEKLYVNDTQVETDYVKIIDIVRKSGYRGFLPIETLGEGDPAIKIEALFRKVKSVLNNQLT